MDAATKHTAAPHATIDDDDFDAFLESSPAPKAPVAVPSTSKGPPSTAAPSSSPSQVATMGQNSVSQPQTETLAASSPVAATETPLKPLSTAQSRKSQLTSHVVPLPRTVVELVQEHERLYTRCEEMRALLDSLRVQANNIVASSPSAGAALGDLLHVVADGDTSLAVAPDGKLIASPQRSASATPPSQSPARRATSGTTPPPAASRPAAASKGVVVTGTVIGSAAHSTGAAVPGGTVVTDDGGTRSRLTRFVEDFTRDYKEECNVLRTQLLAMGAAQQLLAHARDQLRVSEREKRDLQQQLAELKSQATTTDRHACEGDEATTTHIHEGVAPALVKELETARDAAEYEAAQLEKRQEETQRTLSFLKEKNAQLEGQLQRLLMAPQQMRATPPQPALAVPSQTSGGAASSTTTPSVAHPHPPQQHSPSPPPQTVTAEAYNRAASERQIHELRTMVEKLQRRAEANTEKRRQLENTVASLTAENNELKSNVLQYRRQMNESEMNLEREATAKAMEERAKNLEKEVIRLRNALRERVDAYDGKLEALEGKLERAKKESKVYMASTAHLQKALLQCQLRLLIHTRRSQPPREKPSGNQGAARADGERAGSTPGPHGPSPGTAAVSRSGADRKPLSPAKERHPATPSTGGEAAKKTDEDTHSRSGAPSVSNTSFGALQHNREALEEMRLLYERRMETLEAQKRAEVKHVQNLNKELRSALASSQEEVREKNRLLEMARAQNAGGSGGGTTPSWQRPASAALSSLPVPVSQPGAAGGSTAFGPVSFTPVGQRRLQSNASSWGGSALPDPSTHQRLFSTDSTSSRTPATGGNKDGQGGRTLSDIEQDYDPENMSVWEAVQVENEALLRRVSTLQQEKWAVDSALEDAQRQLVVLEREVQRNAATMNQLLKAGVVSPAALQKGPEEGRLRSLQVLLQDTLTQKLALEEEVAQLQERLRQFRA